MEKYKSREIRKQIGNILMAYWDPIGVNDDEGARGEYDNYIYGVFKLLIENANDKEYIEYFHEIEINHMGITASSDNIINNVIIKLREIYSDNNNELGSTDLTK